MFLVRRYERLRAAWEDRRFSAQSALRFEGLYRSSDYKELLTKEVANECRCSQGNQGARVSSGSDPGAVREYVSAGHKVLVETNAGAGIGSTDEDYRKAGATILDSAREVFASSEMIVKVKEPQASNGFSYERTRSFSRICIWRPTPNRQRVS